METGKENETTSTEPTHSGSGVVDRRLVVARDRPFRRWNGRYQKEFYDVLLPSGEIVKNCWPNAGKLNELTGKRRQWKYKKTGSLRVRLAARTPF